MCVHASISSSLNHVLRSVHVSTYRSVSFFLMMRASSFIHSNKTSESQSPPCTCRQMDSFAASLWDVRPAHTVLEFPWIQKVSVGPRLWGSIFITASFEWPSVERGQREVSLGLRPGYMEVVLLFTT
jgi:hypothetical protein